MSVITAAICYASLILALIYNVNNGEIPPNVDTSVRIAQYLAVGIGESQPASSLRERTGNQLTCDSLAMAMEDEVPIGIYLVCGLTLVAPRQTHLSLAAPTAKKLFHNKVPRDSILEICRV